MDESPLTFHEIYQRYADEVLRFAHYLTGSADLAADITAETFVRAWASLESPRMTSIKGYLFTIARNLHRKQWRRASRLEQLSEHLPDPTTPPDETLANREEFQRTLAAVQSLPELDRTILLMRAEDALPYEEIAVATGLSVAAAKVRVLRARAKLTALLKPDFTNRT